MNGLRLWVRNFFGFSRSEANGFLILIPLMICILFSYPIFRFFKTSDSMILNPENEKLDSLLTSWDFNPINEKQEIKIQLHPFDPNELSKTELMQLGFSSYLTNNILNYRSKGGKFNKKEDLRRIYGMDLRYSG